jgi:2-isopropylmalate synthase
MGGFFMAIMKEVINFNPNYIKIFDTTLRDGFQSPGVNVGPEDRLKIANLLAKMRVDVIEAGFPISSQENFESVRTIALNIDGPIICGLSRASLGDIEKNWSAIEPASKKGGARIHTFIATSEIHMRDKLRMTPEQVIARTREAVRRAKEYTPDVEFSPEDASRSDFNFMMRVILEAVDAGATTINIPDTVGYAQPSIYARKIAEVKRRIDRHIGEGLVVISAHCHNDLGLATANTLAAVMAGARQVEVAMNGIGERAGNTSLEEIVANLLTHPEFFMINGIPLSTKIDPSFIFETSELAEKISGMVVQPNKAVVGKNAFAHESGIHSGGMLANRETYEIMKAETFGDRKTNIVIGTGSGHTAIAGRATELGFEIEDQIGFTEKIKNYANRVRRSLTDTEIEKLAADFNKEKLNDKYYLMQAETYGDDHNSSSKINILIDEKSYMVEATGKGPIEAAVKAIKIATGLDIDIKYFAGKSLDSGADAKAGVNLTVQNGVQITAYAEDENVTLAAIKAYVSALNTINRITERKKSNEQY